MDHEKSRAPEHQAVAVLCETLALFGWRAESVYDGEEMVNTPTTSDVLDVVFDLDEASVVFSNGAHRRATVVFVLGNSPDEVICDYTMPINTNFDWVMDHVVMPILDKLQEAIQRGEV